MTALGRSEDFVTIESVDRVTLSTGYEEELSCDCSAYVDITNVRKEKIFTRDRDQRFPAIGTKYAMPKLYAINENGQREFELKNVLYVSRFHAADFTQEDGIYVDYREDGSYYIVNFV